jgi:hypothetical protein
MARLGRRQPFKDARKPLYLYERVPITTQCVSAFGAGYAQVVGPVTTKGKSAFGAGYAQPAMSEVIGVPIDPTEDGYAYLLRNRTARATPSVYVPPIPAPAGLHLGTLGIPRVSEAFDQPTIINGLPYADASKTPWNPSSVTREVPWAKQLQIVVSGDDVTFFRNVPTEIQSWASQEPFGDSSAVFLLPAVTSFDGLREPLAVPVGATVGTASTFTGNGYWTASALGLVTGFGDAAFYGDPLGLLNAPVTGIAASRTGYGYALVAADGGVFCFGNVGFFGSLPGIPAVPSRPCIAIVLTGDEAGYWVIDAAGESYAFGDAPFLGNVPLVSGDYCTAAAPTDGGGYVVLTGQGRLYFFGGSVTDFGNATPFYVAPFVGIGTYPGVDGYLIVNSLGSVYAFGNLLYEGGVIGPLNAPANAIAVGQAVSGVSAGYWIGAGDGGIFTYGTETFYGSIPDGGTSIGGSLSWLSLGADVTINAILADNSVFTLFEGVIADWEDNATTSQIGLSVQCVGSTFQADWYIAKPIPNLPFQGYSPETGNPIFGWDIAQAIPAALSTPYNPSQGTAIPVVYGAVPTPYKGNACIVDLPGGASETGILTVTQPAWDKLLSQYTQNILSQAQSYGGLQYTVGLQRPRTPVLRQKNFTEINWTVSTGGHGVEPDLSLDITTAANAIYGSGTAPPVISTISAGTSTTTVGTAGTWQGAKYPQFPPPAPSFPLGGGAFFSPGDGQTGLQVFTNWMRQSGFPMVSQDTYLATSPGNGVFDYYLIIAWQIQAGIEATGQIDAATWNAAFFSGWDTGAISNVFYMPLAQLADVEPFTYTPSGARQGYNPLYVPQVPRIERYEAMGSQVSKAQGILSATIELTKIQVPSWTGTITLTADPEEGSRFEIVAGQNILLQFWHGRDVLFHISNVSVDFANLKVQLTVSSQPLDLITLAAIYARDTQAHGVARQARPSLVNLNVSSNTTTFDSESSAGSVVPVLVSAGTWSVYRMAASQSGSIAETTLSASPATPFAVGVFSGPVAPSDLTAIFGAGGPLVNDIFGNNPWNDFAPQLDALGLLYGAGGPSGPCGYYPSDPNGTQTLTGNYVDGQTWPYTSAPGYSPWLWVAFWAQNDCFISGRFLPAPQSGV